MQQAAAAVGHRDDSSDSSSSQLASQQHGVSVLPGIPDRSRTGSSSRQVGMDATAAAVRDANGVLQARAELAQDSGHAVGILPNMTKQQAADAVKALIKPLYAAEALSRDQFKTVAQICTHALANSRLSGGSTAVREVVCGCLTDMGLGDTAAKL